MNTDEKVKLSNAIIGLLQAHKDITFKEKYRILASVLELSSEDSDQINVRVY